ncbi:MAG: hypothetical protein LBI33_13350 [Propionibacteriaceae bacterium]|nr:hypothetical protein [Propionibacteriaceae bacterium]
MATDDSSTEVEREQRLTAMERDTARFATWVKPGISHPASASEVYDERQVGDDLRSAARLPSRG